MQIVKHPDPILSTPSVPVEINDEVRTFCSELVTFMQSQEWGTPVGMAAPQVGKNWRIFVALDEVFINPTILWTPKGGDKYFIEGCYSLEENKPYTKRRPYAVRLKWQTLDGEWHEEKFVGLLANVIQHEMDHLEGKLCNEA